MAMRTQSLALVFVFCMPAAPALAGAAPAAAAEPNLMGTFREWHVYNTGAGADRSCFAVSPPQAKVPANVNRGSIFFMITNWPGRNVRNQPSVVPGYPYKEMSSVTVEIGAEKFEFFTQNDGGAGGAWMESPDGEQKLIAAMRKGTTMTVAGTSQRGTNTRDSYSLAGITAALDKLAGDCK
jgi:Invasion associated locus B (IalB) protein